MRAHRNALVAIRSFWQLLLHNQVSFTSLSKALMRIEKSVNVVRPSPGDHVANMANRWSNVLPLRMLLGGENALRMDGPRER